MSHCLFKKQNILKVETTIIIRVEKMDALFWKKDRLIKIRIIFSIVTVQLWTKTSPAIAVRPFRTLLLFQLF